MFKNHLVDKLTVSDYPEILNLWESSVRATHHFLSEADIQVYKLLISTEYLDQLKLYGVRTDQHILGFIAINRKQIRLLFILPEVRGTGIGIALINYVYQHLGVNEVDVNEQNKQACDFYNYLGFVITERSEIDAIGKPFPVISMKLP
ncbi:GNAT family N-acetyltransferase [Pedobacter sp. L105]|uniref:GNAT family N-acetyltransferase n=1 Tax=Pedobacter sp. L105 TaxID=1641871 RepID=UPI00131DA915|nr:GNAT family N-acetyltransferase [Pedobacter sp. L105]